MGNRGASRVPGHPWAAHQALQPIDETDAKGQGMMSLTGLLLACGLEATCGLGATCSLGATRGLGLELGHASLLEGAVGEEGLLGG